MFFNFEIKLSFLEKPFIYITNNSEQKCKHLKNENSFYHEMKSLFHNFKEFSVVKNCLRPENGSFIGCLAFIIEIAAQKVVCYASSSDATGA